LNTCLFAFLLETAPQNSVVEHVKANTIHLYVSRSRNQHILIAILRIHGVETAVTVYTTWEQPLCTHRRGQHTRTSYLNPQLICAGGRYADAQILMDEGAQMSFISQKLAYTLHLQRDGSDLINLSSFGDPAHSVKQLDTATIYLVATDGEMIPIRVLIVPVISKPITNPCRQSVTDLQYLRGLRLAHPVTMADTFEISRADF